MMSGKWHNGNFYRGDLGQSQLRPQVFALLKNEMVTEKESLVFLREPSHSLRRKMN